LRATGTAGVLGLKFPLLQAGMGGIAGHALAAAVSNAGCGGVLGLYKMSPSAIALMLSETETASPGPFGVNVIPEVLDEDSLNEQVETVLFCSRQDVFVTSFGLLPRRTSEMVRAAGRALVIQVGTAAEASCAVKDGVDVLVLQGSDAGGHHLGTGHWSTLLSEVAEWKSHPPLFVSGGIGHGGDLARAVGLGADGCLCGTMFVPATESLAHPEFKRRVVGAGANDTVVTDTFSIGWADRRHRVLVNETVRQASALSATFIATTTVEGTRYPIPRFSAVVPTVNTQGLVNDMAMYAGTSCALVTASEPARTVIARFRAQYLEARGS
jgi:nitronate monooxygenase